MGGAAGGLGEARCCPVLPGLLVPVSGPPASLVLVSHALLDI